jgi:hypothetical protein
MTTIHEPARACLDRPVLRAVLAVAPVAPCAARESAFSAHATTRGPRSELRTLLADGYICTPAEPPEVPWIHRHHIVRWAHGNGWRLVRVVEDPASARSIGGRAELLGAVERVESRESDGIVVARVKCIGSSLEEALDAIERVQAAGGRFVSVCDGVDFGTQSGRRVFRLLVSVARW